MRRQALTSALIAACLVVAVPAAGRDGADASRAARAPGRWVGAWSASPVSPGWLAAAIPLHAGSGGRTVRNLVHISLGGRRVRVRLSNVFGTRTARFSDVRVGVSVAGAGIRPGTSRRLRFAGATSVAVPAGHQVTSDPVALSVRAGEELAVSIYAPGPTGVATTAGSLNHTNFISGPGDLAGAAAARAFPSRSPAWYWLGGVDVLAYDQRAVAIVALGDSITAGYNSTLDANRGWVDLLGQRLRIRSGAPRSVLNAGIAGNNLHEDSPCYGQSALHRLTRDALDQTGARYVILDEGVNDITHPTEPVTAPLYQCLTHRRISAAGMIALFVRAVRRIHAAHCKAIGVTLSPFGRYAYWSPAVETERMQINRWIRTTNVFDGVIDFDRVLRDPAHRAWLNPAYDSGDHLHPDNLGHAAMARAIDLALFGS